MIVPQDVWNAAAAEVTEFMTIPLPTSTQTATPTPLPTVIPNLPIVYTQEVGDVGHRTLWVVCVLMGLSSLAFYAMAARVPVHKRLFHIITALITTFAFISYFAMATGDGVGWHTTVLKESKHRAAVEIVKRQVYWARYVDWSITTPLLLLDLSLLSGLSGANILVAIVADAIMILTGLFAAFGHDDGQKWGWYAIGCIAYLAVVYQLGWNGRLSVAHKDDKTKKFFTSIALFTLVLWTLYPIIWGFADGARMVNVDGEIVAYAVLDILAKPVFGFWLLFTHDRVSQSSPSLEGFWAHGISDEGSIRVGEGRVHDED